MKDYLVYAILNNKRIKWYVYAESSFAAIDRAISELHEEFSHFKKSIKPLMVKEIR